MHGDRLAIVRPTYVVGRDGRHRPLPGVGTPPRPRGDVLAPGTPDHCAQVADVRDLADLLLRLAADRATGPFNAVRTVGRVVGLTGAREAELLERWHCRAASS